LSIGLQEKSNGEIYMKCYGTIATILAILILVMMSSGTFAESGTSGAGTGSAATGGGESGSAERGSIGADVRDRGSLSGSDTELQHSNAGRDAIEERNSIQGNSGYRAQMKNRSASKDWSDPSDSDSEQGRGTSNTGTGNTISGTR
jgi:hypothetical protein